MKLRATTRIRNHKMLEARESLGLNQQQAADLCGIKKATYMRLECLDYPKEFSEKTQNIICKISFALEIPTDDIMTEELAGAIVQNKTVKVATVTTERMLDYIKRENRMILQSPSDIIDKEDDLDLIKQFIEKLSYREKETLKLRYGLDGEGCYTRGEIGRIFKVTLERVKQIEEKAIRKLNVLFNKHNNEFEITKLSGLIRLAEEKTKKDREAV